MARGREKATVQTAPAEGPWELPEGWRWERLISVTSPPKKGDPAKLFSDTFRYIDVGGLADGEPVKLLPVAQAPSRARQLVKSGDTLLSGVRVNLKRNLFIDGDYADVASTAFSVLRPNPDLVPEFLFYWVNSDIFMRWLLPLQRGGTPPAVLDQDVRDQLIPVPPLETQRRIVARIDELLSELDDGETALAHAREDLEIYRKALLKAAVTGELTADWRAANPCTETGEQLLKRILAERKSSSRSNRQAIREIEDAHLWGIPKTWAWCRTDVAGFVQLGRQRTPKDHVGPDMRPYLRVANVFEDRICTADVKQMNFSDKEYEIYRLNAGDILLNEGQSLELIGRPAMFRGEVDGCCFQNTLVRFQAARGVNPEFALLTFLDAMHRGRFRRIAKITTNIAHLGAARFAELGFPLPPEEEQSEIVRLYRGQVDDLKSMADTLQTTSSLRQSILAAAFKGELVQ